jgi:UDP-N-acetylglucosamine 3-dehydrogenase
MERLKVAMIGTGFIGWYHARVYHESFGADLVAIADSDKSLGKRVRDEFGCTFYTDYREMLQKENIDAVDICLPDANHVQPSIDAASAGKHILLEKPMARTYADCRKIKDACDAGGSRILVAHVLRFDAGYKRLFDAVDSGEIGEVIHMTAERKNSRLLAQRLKGRTSMLFYVGVHDIDMVQWCAQKRITRVYAQRIVNVNRKWNSEDCIYVLANLGEGTIANFEYAWTLPEAFPTGLKSRLEIYGSKSTAFLNRFNHGVEIFKERDADLPYELTDIIHWPELNDRIIGDLKVEIDHFIDALLNDTEFVMSVEDAMSAINVIEAIMESYETGVPVDVKEV